MNKIDKILVLTLESSTDRQEYVKKHLNEMGLDNFEFFYAIDVNSELVKSYYKEDKIFKYPNCFRCRREKCGCFNNIIVPTQVSNYLSYYHMMKKVIDDDYQITLFCEDDIQFYDYAMNTFQMLTDNVTFEMNEPLILRLGSSKQEQSIYHQTQERIQLVPNIIVSNPCFLINLNYAKLFVEKFEERPYIEMTSDMFIHQTLSRQFKQSYTIKPQIARELSWDTDSIFETTIHSSNNTTQKKRVESVEEYETYYNQWIS